eukprot:TRINITY_DN36184_c0_g1_i1.p1 TRINITY_DN36184_c0_g1~~TRINITY_DN36184_c0_g1_i1.p1  ORF type:complete len:493 (+),score=125.24 TRINITY_DN36184_c0_g1_i1:73-1551(+)
MAAAGDVPAGSRHVEIPHTVIPHTEFVGTMGHVEPVSHSPSPVMVEHAGKIAAPATTDYEATQSYMGRPLAMVTVGLPARGKSYIARRICRFLNWLGLKSAVFIVEAYRKRAHDGPESPELYDHENREAVRMRDEIVRGAVGGMIQWMREGGKVAILDGQNVRADRREMIHGLLSEVLDEDRIVFLEVGESCSVRLERYRMLTLKNSSTFSSLPREESLELFAARERAYQRAYQPLTEDHSYIRMSDGGADVELNRVHGYVPCRIANFVRSVNLSMQPILMSRHGQSEYNELCRIGGDSGLSRFGERYAEALSAWLDEHAPPGMEVWCSTLVRTRMTVTPLKGKWPIIYWRPLEEIDAGICDGRTYEEIEERYPDEFKKRKEDKYWYRYPHGESYHDLVVRLEPVIMELERAKKPILIVAHQAVLRVIYAYIADRLPEHCTRLSMPLHTVVQVEPTYDGKFTEHRFPVLPTDPDVANVGTDGRADVINPPVF